jgi:hypothetical protein
VIIRVGLAKAAPLENKRCCKNELEVSSTVGAFKSGGFIEVLKLISALFYEPRFLPSELPRVVNAADLAVAVLGKEQCGRMEISLCKCALLYSKSRR